MLDFDFFPGALTIKYPEPRAIFSFYSKTKK